MQDRRFFLMVLNLEKATQAQLDDLTNRINNLVSKYTRGGQITDIQALTREVNLVVDGYYRVFIEHMQISAEAVGSVRASQAVEEMIPVLIKAGLYKEATQLYNDVRNYAASARKRLMLNKWAKDQVPLGYRIKTIKEGTQKTVMNIIQQSFVEKKGSAEVAKLLEQYINPVSSAPSEKARLAYIKKYGRPMNYTPKNVSPATVRYQALRIARTEMAHIYRQATLDFYEDKDYIKGYSWNLSNRHPRTDECNDYSKIIYETREDIPEAHPNCLCDIRPVRMTEKEMKELRYGYEDSIYGGGPIGNQYRDARGLFSNQLVGRHLEDINKVKMKG